MTDEPKRRRDNRCARYPTCKRMIPKPAVAQKGVDERLYLLEPFCSRACCEIWYGEES